MRPSLVGIIGQAGAGKDTIADHLVREHGFVKVSFADPMKRFAREVFDFAEHQVWGNIDAKNTPDPRWDGLTPRFALQTLGTEWGRGCHPDVWIRYALRIADALRVGGWRYTPSYGLFEEEGRSGFGVVIADCRFANEIAAVRKAGGATVRVRRPGFEGAVGVAHHASEEDQKSLPDSSLDAVFENDGTIPDLLRRVDGWLGPRGA